jgi:hypothetical protein
LVSYSYIYLFVNDYKEPIIKYIDKQRTV